jgi:hypothetical protein
LFERRIRLRQRLAPGQQKPQATRVYHFAQDALDLRQAQLLLAGKAIVAIGNKTMLAAKVAAVCDIYYC